MPVPAHACLSTASCATSSRPVMPISRARTMPWLPRLRNTAPIGASLSRRSPISTVSVFCRSRRSTTISWWSRRVVSGRRCKPSSKCCRTRRPATVSARLAWSRETHRMIRKQSSITRLMASNYSAPTLMIRTHVCAGALMLLMYAMIGSATAGQTITVYAAGSLKSALSDLAESFESATGHKVSARYGASGLLKDEISKGAKADVFASANMEHPQALHEQNKSGPVIRFARNTLCALVKPGPKVDSSNLLEYMLDPGVKLGTSTPKADPSGDYALEVFRKADAIRPGARTALENKALQLTGAADSAKPPSGRTVYGWHVAEEHADIFLTYCTNALAAQKENPRQQIVNLPDNLAVSADYGLTVLSSSSPTAKQFTDFIMSPDGQAILTKHGFTPGK